MLRPRVLIVDHHSDHWKNINGHASTGQFELQILEDGLEAYMECAQNNFETLLIREDLPGVPGHELAETVLNNHPDTQVVLFGCNGTNGHSTSYQSRHIQQSPNDAKEAAQLLEKVVTSTSPA